MFSKLLSIPKTVWFNFCKLPFKQAIKLPVAIHYNVKCSVKRGGLEILSPDIKPFMIRIGFHSVPIVSPGETFIYVRGKLIFYGTAHIGRGSRIVIHNNAIVELGNNFAISSQSYINCFKHIKTGNDIQLAWGIIIMDSDTHIIYGENKEVINENKEIILGNKIWIGCDCKVLKGAFIPDNCVVGANSIVTAVPLSPNSLIIGAPAKVVKRITGFKI